MKFKLKKQLLLSMLMATTFSASAIFAHGDVTPQAVDASALEQIGDDWVEVNPYVGNEDAIRIGASAYNSNCARCHGIEAVSGGIAPDLRQLENGEYGDEYYLPKVRNGVIRNDVTYMPGFEGILSQEAMWAIRAWLESVSIETIEAAEKTEEKTETGAEEQVEEKAEEKTEEEPAATEDEKKNDSVAVPAANTETTSTEDDPNKRLPVVLARGVLDVAVYKDFPPYSYVEKGLPTGIDVDIARALAERLSLSASIRLVGADEDVSDDLRNNIWRGHYLGGGTADVMLHMPYDSDYQKKQRQVRFLAPYQTETIAFALNTDTLGTQPNLMDFKEHLIGVEIETLSSFYLLRAFGGELADNVRHYKGMPEAIAALKSGEVAAVMGTRGEIQGILGSELPDGVVIERLETPGLWRDSWAMGMAVKADYEDLAEALNKGMAELVQAGKIEQIFAQYGVDYKPPAKPSLAQQ